MSDLETTLDKVTKSLGDQKTFFKTQTAPYELRPFRTKIDWEDQVFGYCLSFKEDGSVYSMSAGSKDSWDTYLSKDIPHKESKLKLFVESPRELDTVEKSLASFIDKELDFDFSGIFEETERTEHVTTLSKVKQALYDKDAEFKEEPTHFSLPYGGGAATILRVPAMGEIYKIIFVDEDSRIQRIGPGYPFHLDRGRKHLIDSRVSREDVGYRDLREFDDWLDFELSYRLLEGPQLDLRTGR